MHHRGRSSQDIYNDSLHEGIGKNTEQFIQKKNTPSIDPNMQLKKFETFGKEQ